MHLTSRGCHGDVRWWFATVAGASSARYVIWMVYIRLRALSVSVFLPMLDPDPTRIILEVKILHSIIPVLSLLSIDASGAINVVCIYLKVSLQAE